jgi:hypothetical protein
MSQKYLRLSSVSDDVTGWGELFPSVAERRESEGNFPPAPHKLNSLP